ncbi:hypothetical protein MSC49_10600 [Methylosinus sp. C49]|nr:hypothetical protein MSC49_10600 [Methylosinus sp. C49]
MTKKGASSQRERNRKDSKKRFILDSFWWGGDGAVHEFAAPAKLRRPARAPIALLPAESP